MNLTQLRAFHAVAREGSFTKAAERLCITQPAVTASITALEERHGVALFHRQGRSITLTEAGEKLAAVSQKLFTLEEEAAEVLAAEQGLQSGTLRICVGSPYSIAPVLARFREKFPGIDLRIIPGNYQIVRDLILSENADLAVQTEAEEHSLLGHQPLAQQRLVAICHRDFPLPAGPVSLKNLSGFDLVARETGSGTRRLVRNLCEEHGADLPIRITAESREAVFEMVANGLGYGLVLDAEMPQDGRVRVVPVIEAEKPLTDYLLYLKRRENLRLVRAFLALAKGA